MTTGEPGETMRGGGGPGAGPGQAEAQPALQTNFFKTQFGNYADLPLWRKREFGLLVDPLLDLRLRMNSSFRGLGRRLAAGRRLRVLVTGVEVPSRAADLQQMMQTLAQSRHEVVCRTATMHNGLGKSQNINRALEGLDLEAFDWLIVTDDDMALPPKFLDTFLGLAELADLSICMPAHRYRSYLGYRITQRRWNSLVRETHFVECGPLTAFRRDAFAFCLPFPELRWAWGTDVVWSQQAWDCGQRIGIVDGCAVEHLRPIAGSYDGKAARLEGESYLRSAGVHRQQEELLQDVQVMRRIP